MSRQKYIRPKPKCPYCEGVITNFSELILKKKYKCQNCGGRYFVIKQTEVYAGF